MIELIKAAFAAQIMLAELSVDEKLNKQIKAIEKCQQKKI